MLARQKTDLEKFKRECGPSEKETPSGGLSIENWSGFQRRCNSHSETTAIRERGKK